MCITFFLSFLQVIDHPVVTLNEPNSKIRGHILKSYNGKDYYAFQDIPYAEAPVGDNRYAVSITEIIHVTFLEISRIATFSKIH